MNNQVEHPEHYGGENNIYEAIKVITTWNLSFSLGNVVKYISRAGRKDKTKEVEDLKKARFYLDYHIKTLETEQTPNIKNAIFLPTPSGDYTLKQTCELLKITEMYLFSLLESHNYIVRADNIIVNAEHKNKFYYSNIDGLRITKLGFKTIQYLIGG